MIEYHKIKTVFSRNPETKFKTLMEGKYAKPEFAYLKNNEWQFTEKVDGTNIRLIYKKEDNNIIIRGKTDNASIPSFLLEAINKKINKDKFNEIFGCDVCIYGEGYGVKIQKGGGNYVQNTNENSFVIFDIKIGNWWLQRQDVEDIAEKLNIEIVPIIGTGKLVDMISMCRQGFNSKWGNFKAEGIVARPVTEMFNRNGERIITKLKTKDFTNGK